MRWYHWLIVPIIVLLVLLAFLIGRRGSVTGSIATEMDALEARALAKRWQSELTAKRAADMVQKRYRDKMAKLNSEAIDEVNRLRSDPVALADHLARLSE